MLNKPLQYFGESYACSSLIDREECLNELEEARQQNNSSGASSTEVIASLIILLVIGIILKFIFFKILKLCKKIAKSLN